MVTKIAINGFGRIGRKTNLVEKYVCPRVRANLTADHGDDSCGSSVPITCCAYFGTFAVGDRML